MKNEANIRCIHVIRMNNVFVRSPDRIWIEPSVLGSAYMHMWTEDTSIDKMKNEAKIMRIHVIYTCRYTTCLFVIQFTSSRCIFAISAGIELDLSPANRADIGNTIRLGNGLNKPRYKVRRTARKLH